MTFPEKAVVGAKHQSPSPTEIQIHAVKICQVILRNAGLHTEADLLVHALSRPEFVCEKTGWWMLSAESVLKANVEAEQLL